MSLILGIETSTKICSVALSKDGELIAVKEQGGEYSHAEKLISFVNEVMKEGGAKWEDIDAVAVSKGPGSYTGLRIGVSTAKGLCYALSKPLISVDTLQAMAMGAVLCYTGEEALFCPMIDARRMEVYTAIFNSKNEEVVPISAKILDESSFEEYLKNDYLVFFGDGSQKCRELLKNASKAIFIEEGLPSAEYINAIAYQKLKKKELEDVAYFEPYYLKDFVGTTAKKLF